MFAKDNNNNILKLIEEKHCLMVETAADSSSDESCGIIFAVVVIAVVIAVDIAIVVPAVVAEGALFTTLIR